MRLIYLHGLNSDANSKKGQLLHDYCIRNHPEVRVLRPDLNLPPPQVMDLLDSLLAEPEPTAVVGMSLGGFFALKMHERHACPMVLLNPSIRPDQSLTRFFPCKNPHADTVGHTTEGGWQLKWADIEWFAANPAPPPQRPERCLLLVQTGDELLDYRKAVAHCAGARHIIEAGGDHRISDFHTKPAQIVPFLLSGA
ncbi:YqiA/YcfP family alpha/beta fold hydrolase [Conchiformibius kuhniae]|uniref:YqiA/YcfP family alpha/beta fold hydrolase n=1 Tax=Conchiformibius kuhniae TaxID=211502 RepID=A0A8T9N043_9NEIS|nr:YqiA/YcfP family alpha/beta fold hydrolase [Conchiformibius kuhniae]UOP05383.1 hypothetical protein LVJ77_04115 [Conchiformibius kuhniae]